MENLKTKTEELIDDVQDYLETFYKLTIVNVTQKITNVATLVVTIVCIFISVMFFVLFLGIGAAWWIGNLIENRAAGFFIMAGVFLLFSLLIILLRKIIFPPIRNFIVKRFYD